MTSPFLTNNILLINLAVMLVATSVVGAVMTVLWLCIGKILEKAGFVNIVFELLKLAVFFYLFPLVYLLLKVFEAELGRGYLFAPTGTMLKVVKCFLIVWGSGSVIILSCVLHSARQFKRGERGAFPCNTQAQKIFEEVAYRLGTVKIGSRNPLKLQQSYRAKVPYIVGIFRPKVILPVGEYSTEELEFIFMHEIMHYKQKDVLLKRLAVFICVTNFYNPCAWLLLKQIQRWSEYACDYRVCEKTGRLKEYFHVLMNVSMGYTFQTQLTSQLVENQHELVGRIKKMKKVYGRKRSRVGVAIVLSIAFLFSSMTVGAVTLETAELYMSAEDNTKIEVTSEEEKIHQYEVFVDNDQNSIIQIVEISEEQTTRAINAVDWVVRNNYRVVGPYFNCEEGDIVTVMFEILPSNITVKVGIEDVDGTRVYINSSDFVSSDFLIEESGKYRIYVENLSGQDATVTGNYRIP